ncbi:MAG: hypothetical protein GXY68_07605 [Chloroflexi bacterium]|jgi:hypothetical protein|nr:hypothetical protein [Chloroflexota bacterium]
MTEHLTACPYCGDVLPAEDAICPACHENLAGLIQLEKRHLLLYNEALDAARSGDLESARVVLLMSLRARSDFGPGYRLLAKVYAAQGNVAQARLAAQAALKRLPGDADLEDLIKGLDQSTHADILAQESIDGHPAAPPPSEASAERKDIVAAYGAGAALVGLGAFIVGLLRGGRD